MLRPTFRAAAQAKGNIANYFLYNRCTAAYFTLFFYVHIVDLLFVSIAVTLVCFEHCGGKEQYHEAKRNHRIKIQ